MFDLLFLSHSRRHPVQFPSRTFDLASRLFLLRASHLRQGFGQPPASSMQDGYRHLQIVLESSRGWLGGWRLPLRFQKQCRLGEDALADHARALAPGGIELPRLPRITTVLDQSGGHPLTVLHADSRHRHQILHGQLCAKRAFAHLLLNRFRQQLDQRQSPRHPTHAAVEPAPQLPQRVTKALLQFRQQPALFQRAFLGAEAQRTVQQQSFGFAHFPDRGFDCVATELFQRRYALMAVDHQVTCAVVFANHHDDGRLLAALSQRRQQSALPVWLADAQTFPAPVELVKLQLHPRLLGVQYGRSRDWSFAAPGEVCRKVSSDQPHTHRTGLSRTG